MGGRALVLTRALTRWAPSPAIRRLVHCAHPLSALMIAAVVGLCAALDHRGTGPSAAAAGAVLLVALLNGLGNDLCDADFDARAHRSDKPIATGATPRGNASFLVAVLAIVSIPVALQCGLIAGGSLLLCVPVGYLHNRALRRRFFSFLPWMVTGALLVAFLSYGGWGGIGRGTPPTWQMTATAAGLGLALHFFTAIRDLGGDHHAGSRSLPVRLASLAGARTLIALTVVLVLASVAALVLTLLGPGLHAR